MEVDVFFEPGNVPPTSWPGQESLGSKLVGRFTIYHLTPSNPLINFTAVSTVRPESQLARSLAGATINAPDELLSLVGPLRIVLFSLHEVDGQQLPILLEMPVGHWM